MTDFTIGSDGTVIKEESEADDTYNKLHQEVVRILIKLDGFVEDKTNLEKQLKQRVIEAERRADEAEQRAKEAVQRLDEAVRNFMKPSQVQAPSLPVISGSGRNEPFGFAKFGQIIEAEFGEYHWSSLNWNQLRRYVVCALLEKGKTFEEINRTIKVLYRGQHGSPHGYLVEHDITVGNRNATESCREFVETAHAHKQPFAVKINLNPAQEGNNPVLNNGTVITMTGGHLERSDFVARVPLFITNTHKAALRAKGYSDEVIRVMLPAKAMQILGII